MKISVKLPLEPAVPTSVWRVLKNRGRLKRKQFLLAAERESESVETGISRADAALATAASHSGETAAARSCSASGLRHDDAMNEKRQEP